MIEMKKRLQAVRGGFKYDLANRLWIYGQLSRTYKRLLDESLASDIAGVKFGFTEIGGESALHLVIYWKTRAPGADKLALCRQAERQLMEKFVPDGMDLLRSDVCVGAPATTDQS
jgi:hypothetical protein